jgi:hypothetical protein
VTETAGKDHSPLPDALDHTTSAAGSTPPTDGDGTGSATPARRRWYRRPSVVIAAVVALIVLVCVLVDLPQHSSPAQQAAGIATVVKTVNSEVHPCAYAVSTAFSLHHSQVTHQLTASELAKMPTLLEDDLTACTLTDQTVVNLGTLTLPETAAGRELGAAVKGILDWETEDAVAAIGAIQVLRTHPDNRAALATLTRSERKLAADRAAAERAVRAASRELGGADIGAPGLPRLPVPS